MSQYSLAGEVEESPKKEKIMNLRSQYSLAGEVEAHPTDRGHQALSQYSLAGEVEELPDLNLADMN